MDAQALRNQIEVKLFSTIFMVIGVLSIFVASLGFADTKKRSSERIVDDAYIQVTQADKGADTNYIKAIISYPTECHQPKENFVHKTDDANNLYLFHFSVVDSNANCPQVVDQVETAFVLPELENGTYQIFAGNQEEAIGTLQVDGRDLSVNSFFK